MPVRLMFYGGAKSRGENNTFKDASANVSRDYANDMPIKPHFLTRGAHQIIAEINAQANNSIQSIDIFCHGSYDGIYMSMGVSLTQSLVSAKQSNIYGQ